MGVATNHVPTVALASGSSPGMPHHTHVLGFHNKPKTVPRALSCVVLIYSDLGIVLTHIMYINMSRWFLQNATPETTPHPPT